MLPLTRSRNRARFFGQNQSILPTVVALLQEDGSFLLQEDGSKILVSVFFYLGQEDSSLILQENGSQIYV